jgi:hypothetical protein
VNDVRLEHAEKIDSVKYTTVLPRHYIIELKDMAKKKMIASVTQGIRSAVESFISKYKECMYEMEMKEATKDKAFIKRTMETQEMFSISDKENDVKW